MGSSIILGRMATFQASDHWMNDEGTKANPVILGFPMRQASEAVEVPAADRFEAEAMPHLNDIFRTATRLLGDRARAEDVAQEVFLQAWKSFHRFQTGTNCRAWLFKILFHCVNHHRRKWFRFPQLKETEEFLEVNLVSATPIPEQLTDEDILAALDRIPSDFRSIVLLVDIEDFSYKEASDILTVPIGTVMSRLSRGRKALREQLTEVARSYGIGMGKATGGQS
jgi:RNA polymerase sigma-70 factor (ECF subfamily)